MNFRTSSKDKLIDPSDPRWFVRALALPTPDHVGLKIDARHLVSDNAHYNPSEPKRELARVQNYNRRLVQHSLQGFHAAPNKPYQGKILLDSDRGKKQARNSKHFSCGALFFTTFSCSHISYITFLFTDSIISSISWFITPILMHS